MDTVTCIKNISSCGSYSEAFRLEVVEAIVGGKLSQREACSRYGIKGHSTVSKWLKKYQGTRMKVSNKKAKSGIKSEEAAKLLEEKKQLEQALLKATVRIHCLETLLEGAEARYGTDFKKAYIQRS